MRPNIWGMKTALIIGASGGIGAALAAELRARGVAVTGLSRSHDGLDVTDPASVAAHLGALDGPFDLILIAVGILAPAGAGPEKALSAITADQMAQVFAVNTIGPALILGHVPRLLARDGAGRVAVLSARVGSIGDNQIGGWHSYRASKAALNQIIRGAAIELGRSHKQASVIALHPGTVQTAFTANYAGRHPAMPAAQAAAQMLDVITALTPAQTGQFFDFAGQPVPW